MRASPLPAPSPSDTLLAFAESLADLARPIAMRYFRGTFETIAKGDGSPVTIADREIERTMRTRIAACFPDHGIFGEEFGAEIKPTTWVLDPIDGTKSFVTGMPLFGTLIALVEDGAVPVGVIDMPALGERWVGGANGTVFAGRPARTSGRTTLRDAILYTTSPDAFTPEGWQAYERLSGAVGLRRFGGDCYAYGLLASGHCDLVVEENLQPYDYLALVAVVEGAGGRITDWSGERLGFASDGRVVAAATAQLHAAALAVLGLPSHHSQAPVA